MKAFKQLTASGIAPKWEAKTARIVEPLAKMTAIFGGLVLMSIAAITAISIVGRALIFMDLGPIPGDFEIVEMGCAFAIFCFLPWCQLKSGHATVDIFTNPLGPRKNAFLTLLWDVIMTAAMVVLTWRLYAGMTDMQTYGDTTLILQIPVWYGYTAGLAVMCILVLTCLYCIWRCLNSVLMKDKPKWTEEGVNQ